VQNDEVQRNIAEAENLAGLQAGTDYNIVKYDINNDQALSLLWYPGLLTILFSTRGKLSHWSEVQTRWKTQLSSIIESTYSAPQRITA